MTHDELVDAIRRTYKALSGYAEEADETRLTLDILSELLEVHELRGEYCRECGGLWPCLTSRIVIDAAERMEIL